MSNNCENAEFMQIVNQIPFYTICNGLHKEYGSVDYPFVDVSNAVQKGKELTAEYSTVTINIYFFLGDHFALSDYQPYFPLKIDSQSNSFSIHLK